MSIIPSTNTSSFVDVANLMARLSESGLDRQLQSRQQVAALQQQGLDRLQRGSQIRAGQSNARQQAINMMSQNLVQSAMAAAERQQRQKEAELEAELRRELQEGTLTAEKEAQLIQQAGFDRRNQTQQEMATEREQGLNQRTEAQLNQQLQLANQSDAMQREMQANQQGFSAEQNELNRQAQAMRDEVSNELQRYGMDQRRADAAADRMLRAVLQVNQQQFQSDQMIQDQTFRKEMFGAEQTREQELLEQEKQTQLIGDTREIANMKPDEQKTLLLAMPEEDRKAVLGNLLAPQRNEFNNMINDFRENGKLSNAEFRRAFIGSGIKKTLELIKDTDPSLADQVDVVIKASERAGANNVFMGIVNSILQVITGQAAFNSEKYSSNQVGAITGTADSAGIDALQGISEKLGLTQ